MANFIGQIMEKIVKSKNETISTLESRTNNLSGNYDEVLSKLEAEVQSYIKVIPEKLYSLRHP